MSDSQMFPICQSQSEGNSMSKHKSSSSFTPFIDPRLLQISPSSGTSLNNIGRSQDGDSNLVY